MLSETLYIGKKVIELDVVDSTNNYASDLIKGQGAHEGLVVTAHFQEGGKGQRGNVWLSEPGKNLTFSLVLKPKFLLTSEAFMISKVVSLAICKYLENRLSLPIFIKWPNDIYVGKKKACGILIENQFKGNQIEYTVVGIGINVNQIDFYALSNVTSLKLELKQELNLKTELHNILKYIEIEYLRLQKNEGDALNKEYLENLLFIGETKTYKTFDGNITGKITAVLPNGRLVIETVDGQSKNYDIKEIEFLI